MAKTNSNSNNSNHNNKGKQFSGKKDGNRSSSFQKKFGGNSSSQDKPKPTSIKGMNKFLKNKSPKKSEGEDQGKQQHQKKRKFEGSNNSKGEDNQNKRQKNSENKDGNNNNNNNKKGKPLAATSRKPYFQLVEKLKQVWNKIREKSVPTEARNALLQNLLQGVSGHIVEITLRHDASRIIQTLIQFGTDQQREKVLTELSPKLYEIAKAPYGHFTVLKLITYGNTATFMKKISQNLKTHFVSLGIHSIGARTVETVLQLYPTTYTKHLRAEFYGKNFVVLVAEPPTSLRHLIEMLPNKRFPILDHMKDLVNKFLAKGLLDFSFVGELIWEVCEELIRLEAEIDSLRSAPGSLSKEDIDGMAKKLTQFQNELISSALIEQYHKLVGAGTGGQAGSKVLTYLIQVMGAKDRKKLIKLLKGKFIPLLTDPASRWAYLPLAKLFAVTDDSVVLQKTLLEDLKSLRLGPTQYSATGELLKVSGQTGLDLTKPALFNVFRHPTAVKFILAICWNYHHTSEASIWNQSDFDGYFMMGRLATSKTSKKDANQRKKEHLVFLQATLLRLVGGRKYLPELAKDKTAVKALEAVAYTLYPAGRFCENFARLVAGRELLDDEEEEEEEEEEDAEGDEEQGGDEEEMDVAEDEDDDGDEEEDDNEEGDNEDGEGGEAEEDEEELEDADEFNQQLQEAEADKQAILKKQKADAEEAEQQQKELLPMAEDPTAHVLAKRLLRFEAKLEETRLTESFSSSPKETALVSSLAQFNDAQLAASSQLQQEEKDLTEAVQGLNTSLWAEPDQEEEDSDLPAALTVAGIKRTAFNRFGWQLLAELSADDFAALHESNWLAINRPCFLLYEAFRTPSLYLGLSSFLAAYQTARGVSEAEVMEKLGQTDGGRLLSKLLAHQQTALLQTEGKGTGKGKGKKAPDAKTPSKKQAAPAAAPATSSRKKQQEDEEDDVEEEEEEQIKAAKGKKAPAKAAAGKKK